MGSRKLKPEAPKSPADATRRQGRVRRFWPLVALFPLAVLALGLGLRRFMADAPEPPFSVSDVPPAAGLLRVSVYADPDWTSGAGEASTRSAPSRSSGSGLDPVDPPTRHRTTWTNGDSYSGMEDNDLRGFLDGAYKYAWNQTTQVEVRIGRRGNGPKYGEHEIFRVSQRWDDVHLPRGSIVRRASLSLEVMEPIPDTLRLMLYEVKKDWDPGRGGVLHNNVSPPAKGEVWWGEVAHAESSWALPGVGYASDQDPDADTGAMPLAEALYIPPNPLIVFESAELAAYATKRIADGAPLLFLYKMADPYEDTPGSMIMVYSGNAGDSHAVSRRPHLTLEWESRNEIALVEQRILLERGRTLVLPRMTTFGDATVAASFEEDPSGIAPTVEVRSGSGEVFASDENGWSRLVHPRAVAGDSMEVRLTAALQPIVLGDTFQATMGESWIRTGPPEAQIVPWRFVSPSGRVHERNATYVGEWTWAIEFVPDEIGTWTYTWQADWSEDHFDSEVGRFDVLGGSLSNVRHHLAVLKERMDAEAVADPDTLESAMAHFSRLERAALLGISPDAFSSATGDSLRAELRALRTILGGEAVPESIPMVPDKPPLWQRNQAASGG